MNSIDSNTIWTRYLKSKHYQEEQNTVTHANWYWNMYLGNQWDGVKAQSKLPVMNFIRQVVDYKAAAIGQNQMTAMFSDSHPENEQIYSILNSYWKKQWKKEDMDTKMFDMITQSGILGDSVLYFSGKDKCSLLDPSSVLYADEQNNDIQTQRYIMLRIRPFVRDVKATALKNGISEDELYKISSDKEPDYLVGNKKDINYDEPDAKCTAVLYFEKIDGVVHKALAVENLVYEPLHPLAQTVEADGIRTASCSMYPLVKLTCQEVPNSARGRGWVEDLIPNQVEVNKCYARMSQAIANCAYPRVAFNSNAIANPEDLSNIGAPIEVEGNSQSVSSMISYLQGTPMAGDAFTFVDNLFTTTKQVAGANDAISGISDPSRVSGSALSEIREQATINLKGNVIRVKKAYEEIARIRLDMWKVYFPNGITYQREATDEEKLAIQDGEYIDLTETIDGETLRQLEPDIEIDITLRTEATKNDTQTQLDTLMDKGHITFTEWVQVADGDGIVPKEKLQKVIDQRRENGMDENTGLPLEEPMTGDEPVEEAPQ